MKRLLLKKTQQLVSRLDYSDKSIHCGSRSLPYHERRARTPSSPQHDRESAQSTGNSKRDRSETRDDNERSEDSGCSRTPKFSSIEDITDLVQKRLNQTASSFRKEWSAVGLDLRLITVGGNHHTLFREKICDAYLRPLVNLRPPPASSPVPG